jgi:hypothetical protein
MRAGEMRAGVAVLDAEILHPYLLLLNAGAALL